MACTLSLGRVGAPPREQARRDRRRGATAWASRSPCVHHIAARPCSNRHAVATGDRLSARPRATRPARRARPRAHAGGPDRAAPHRPPRPRRYAAATVPGDVATLRQSTPSTTQRTSRGRADDRPRQSAASGTVVVAVGAGRGRGAGHGRSAAPAAGRRRGGRRVGRRQPRAGQRRRAAAPPRPASATTRAGAGNRGRAGDRRAGERNAGSREPDGGGTTEAGAPGRRRRRRCAPGPDQNSRFGREITVRDRGMSSRRNVPASQPA